MAVRLQSHQAEVSDAKRQVVMITGASAGVGRATSLAFARLGARIGLLARGREGLEAARRDVESAGGEAVICQADVAHADQVDAAAGTLEDYDPNRPHNLWNPVDGDRDFGAHGRFDVRARPASWQLWATEHRPTLGAVALAAGLVGIAAMLSRAPSSLDG